MFSNQASRWKTWYESWKVWTYLPQILNLSLFVKWLYLFWHSVNVMPAFAFLVFFRIKALLHEHVIIWFAFQWESLVVKWNCGGGNFHAIDTHCWGGLVIVFPGWTWFVPQQTWSVCRVHNIATFLIPCWKNWGYIICSRIVASRKICTTHLVAWFVLVFFVFWTLSFYIFLP